MTAPVPPQAARASAYALLLVLTALLAVWGAFLVPLRAGTVVVPLSLLLASLQLPVGVVAGRLVGPLGAVGTGALWLAIAVLLASRRPEGDVVVTSGSMGLAYLGVGALASAVAAGLVAGSRRPGGTTPSR